MRRSGQSGPAPGDDAERAWRDEERVIRLSGAVTDILLRCRDSLKQVR
jgi:hypothetical protein